jgi:YVTN family beta-propeller protein
MAQDWRIGTTIAGCRIESLIGRGGMGTVYLAEHIGLQRKVALKILSADLADDVNFRDRFVRESRMAASIEDPNIVPIYEAGESEGVLFIAMRYVRGTDLEALIHAEGALPPERTIAIISQVASALDAAHVQGLIHRDVKPANILVVPGGEAGVDKAYLSDFGLTKRASSESGLTATGQFVGTLDYAAPEQFEARRLTPRTDVYSLGCVVYECLTGEVPFFRDQDAARMYAHLMEPVPRVTDRRPELPEGINDVVARAMAKRAEDRFDTAGELAAAVGAEIRSPAGAVPEGTRPTGRRAAVVVASVALLAALGVFAIFRAGADPTPNDGSATTPSGPSAVIRSPIAVEPNSVLRVDAATSTVSANIGVGSQPHSVAFSGGYLWVVNQNDRTVSRIDPETNQVVAVRGGLTGPCYITPDPGGGVWVTNCLAPPYAVARLDPATGEVDVSIALPDAPGGVAFGGGDVWVTLPRLDLPTSIVLRIDPSTEQIRERIEVGMTAVYVVFGEGALWVANTGEGTVSRIDVQTDQITSTITVGAEPRQIAFGDGYVWVSDRTDHSISKIDPLEERVVDIIHSVRGSLAIEGDRSLWVADMYASRLWRIDTFTDDVTAEFTVRYSGYVAVGAGSVWVSAPSIFDDPAVTN